MTRRNRVDPWGDLHAVDARGLFTGNRGSLVDESGAVVRHHRSSTLWITCLTEFRGHRQPLADPHRWTPIFFLDEAVALAAGHRPCAYCRRADYEAYRSALARWRPTAVGARARPAPRQRATPPRARAVEGRRPTAVAGVRRLAPRRHGRARRRAAAVPPRRREAASLHVRRVDRCHRTTTDRRRADAADVGGRALRRLPADPPSECLLHAVRHRRRGSAHRSPHAANTRTSPRVGCRRRAPTLGG